MRAKHVLKIAGCVLLASAINAFGSSFTVPSAPTGTAGTKNTGSSVVSPDGAKLEIAQQLKTGVTGSSKVWAAGDCNLHQQRSNSGTAMTDTLPASGCTEITIENTDASGATDTISVAGGGTIKGSTTFGLLAGRRATFDSDGAGNYGIWISNNSELRLTQLETSAPSTPASGSSGIWADSTDHNAEAKDSSGNIHVMVRPTTATTHQFATAIAANGTVTKAQPAASDVSGLAPIATSGSATDLTTGTIPNGRVVALPNANLANSTITIAGHSVALGGSQALAIGDLSNIATGTIVGNNSGSLGAPLALTATQAKALLAIAASDVSGLAPIATSGSATDLTTGTIPNGRVVALPNANLANSTITIAGHSVALGGSQALAIGDLSNIATGTIVGNNSGSPGAPLALTATQAKALLAIAASDVSGLAPIATSGSATDLSTGNVPAARNTSVAPGDVLGNSGGSSASASDNTMDAILDKNYGTTQGGVDYRGAAGRALLAPGTSGQALCTAGAAANPYWCSMRSFFAAAVATSHTQAANVTDYYTCSGLLQVAPNSSEVNAQCLAPLGGTFRNLYVLSNVAAPGSGNTFTITLRVNNADTAVTCTISNAGTTCNDTTHSVTITAGQTFDMKIASSSAAAASAFDYSFELDTP